MLAEKSVQIDVPISVNYCYAGFPKGFIGSNGSAHGTECGTGSANHRVPGTADKSHRFPATKPRPSLSSTVTFIPPHKPRVQKQGGHTKEVISLSLSRLSPSVQTRGPGRNFGPGFVNSVALKEE
eukprot:2254484-Rhodomonas_salina.4